MVKVPDSTATDTAMERGAATGRETTPTRAPQEARVLTTSSKRRGTRVAARTGTLEMQDSATTGGGAPAAEPRADTRSAAACLRALLPLLVAMKQGIFSFFMFVIIFKNLFILFVYV